MKKLFWSYLIFCPLLLTGQDTLLYSKESIYLSGSQFIKNNQRYPFKELKTEMQISPDAIIYYNKMLKQRRTSLIITTISAAAFTSALFLVNDQDVRNALYLGSIVGAVTSVFFSDPAEKNLHKAIWLRNRDVYLIQ